jgi:hypothetical protein
LVAPKKAPQCSIVAVDDRWWAGNDDGVLAAVGEGVRAGTDDGGALGVEERKVVVADGRTDMVDGRRLDDWPDEQAAIKSTAATIAPTPTIPKRDFLITNRDDLFVSLGWGNRIMNRKSTRDGLHTAPIGSRAGESPGAALPNVQPALGYSSLGNGEPL